ncbi:bifunctional nuclease 2 isoform X1 [Arachis ipaensis]|uniref:bifunctional nuclease 2 isoform X1 n=1 Tax=Arachis ipaensis TaxID=130454 RepID=UPI000A2B9617|nr:bifunctional nuclease 2 isoform X1 [Arachis ipaensis]
MLCSRFCVRTIPGVATVADHGNATRCSSTCVPHSSLAMDLSPLHHHAPSLRTSRLRCRKSVLISCDSSRGPSRTRSSFGDHHDDYLEASLLLSETISHYHMWRHRSQEELQWKSSTPSIPIAVQGRNLRSDNNLMRQSFLQRFQNPTIFLKISCDGDYILPIVVGKVAIEKLIDPEVEENGVCPDQFQLAKNVVERLDHEVIMVRITERVVSTYFARVYLSQPGKSNIISVDARPSDAINIANRCKAPIYVSKQIVLADAIRLGYGMGRAHNKRPTYDVVLDSAVDGPDLVAEELSMMNNMHIAIKQEKFEDAVGLILQLYGEINLQIFVNQNMNTNWLVRFENYFYAIQCIFS